MIRILAAATLGVTLVACQGVVGPGGQLAGITVPPGCKAQGNISFPVAQGGICFQCDETGLPSPPAGARIQLR